MIKKFFLSAIMLCLFISGCGPDQYTIEREFWFAQKKAEKIFANPHASPPNQLAQAIKTLSEFAAKYPENILAVSADFIISRLYIAKEEYESARMHLRAVLDKYKNSDAISSEITFFIGKSYELQDKWSLALEQYKKIIRDYPVTLRGLDSPVYIAQYYKEKYEPDKMLAAFQEAIKHYRQLSSKYPGTPLAFNALNLAARAHMSIKEWQGAVSTFDEIIENYKDKINVSGQMFDQVMIYSQELKNKAKALEVLQSIITLYPGTKISQQAEKVKKELGKK